MTRELGRREMGLHIERYVRKDMVVEYDMVIIVIIHSYANNDIEPNDKIVKLGHHHSMGKDRK